eukprot:3994595-Prymnesium_polylepis.1
MALGSARGVVAVPGPGSEEARAGLRLSAPCVPLACYPHLVHRSLTVRPLSAQAHAHTTGRAGRHGAPSGQAGTYPLVSG